MREQPSGEAPAEGPDGSGMGGAPMDGGFGQRDGQFRPMEARSEVVNAVIRRHYRTATAVRTSTTLE